MSLKEVKIKSSYDSDEDDLINDFYVPVLAESVEYDRLTGSFSSSALAAAARGIADFIKNGGKMRILSGINIDPHTIQAVQFGEELKEKISSKLIKELENIENELAKDHIAALAWLVATNRLEIKIAVPIVPINDKKEMDDHRMFHQKIGILRDSQGNCISFSGSNNETHNGWEGNIEEFKVFKGWNPSQVEYVNADIKKFNKYWNDKAKRAKVLDIPEVVKQKLKEIAPEDQERVLRRLIRHYKGKAPVTRVIRRRLVFLSSRLAKLQLATE